MIVLIFNQEARPKFETRNLIAGERGSAAARGGFGLCFGLQAVVFAGCLFIGHAIQMGECDGEGYGTLMKAQVWCGATSCVLSVSLHCSLAFRCHSRRTSRSATCTPAVIRERELVAPCNVRSHLTRILDVWQQGSDMAGALTLALLDCAALAQRVTPRDLVLVCNCAPKRGTSS